MQAEVDVVPTDSTAALDEPAPEAREERMWPLLLRWMFGLGVVLGAAFVLGKLLRPQLEHTGQRFVEQFGVLGMALGTFLADGFHVPIPPQFYMLLAISSGGPQLPALLWIALGSLCGGGAGYWVAHRLGQLSFVQRFFARSLPAARSVYEKHGYRALLIASLTPIAFSVLCYAAGISKLPKRAFALLALCRLPKLVIYYYLVRLGWG